MENVNITKKYKNVDEAMKIFAIRKLTPEECFVLQGMTMEDVQKCRNLDVANCQLYKQAGNGLTTNSVQFLMEHLYKSIYDNDYITTDEKMVSEGYGI